MNCFFETRMCWNLSALMALLILPQAGCATGESVRAIDLYDSKSIETPYGRKIVPWVPGTEGQKETRIQVLDATTMQPIEGAIVVGGYSGAGGHSGGSSCVNSESALSDAQGWLTLPNDQAPRILSDQAVTRGPNPVSAYKRGYQLAKRVYYAESGGNNEWYIREYKAAPYGSSVEQSPILSARKFSVDQKSALLESKERSRIYLMPSTAKTKEERERELNWIDAACSPYPFSWSPSEGGVAIKKAIYQELIDIDYFSERGRKKAQENIEHYERGLREIRDEAKAKAKAGK